MHATGVLDPFLLNIMITVRCGSWFLPLTFNPRLEARTHAVFSEESLLRTGMRSLVDPLPSEYARVRYSFELKDHVEAAGHTEPEA